MEFVPEALLIALREGLEALLITGVLLILVTRLGHPEARRHVWLGFGAAAATSVLAGWVIFRFLFMSFEEQGLGAWFELVAALLAVATLTYMAFWMWGHTHQLIAAAKKKVHTALTSGALATIVFIAYISVLREGLETVLFYSALSANNDWSSILTSGAIGFALSAILVVLILTGAKKIPLHTFMAVTGFFLIVVAAMLLTHVATALIDLGILGPQRAIWDTSHIIADDSAIGRILHAIMGYTAAPILLQALLYTGYLFIAGGLYLWRIGVFRRNTEDGKAVRSARTGVFAAVALLAFVVIGASAMDPTDTWITGHEHGEDDHHAEAGIWDLPHDAKVGVLLRNHGEPVEYNATTYESFAEFMRNLLEMIDMEELLLVDQGTVLLDASRPFEPGPNTDPDLIDAWLESYNLPAAYVGSPFPEIAQVPLADGYYLGPGGPGFGEPDILEVGGLSAYQSWLQMENLSPMHYDKQDVLDETIRHVMAQAGDKVVATTGYHILPHVGPDERIGDAIRILMEQEVTHIVDAYTSALHSDVMNGCMMEPHARQAIEAAGFDGPVLTAGPSGTDPAFASGVADHMVEEIARHDEQDRIAVFLTHHGLDPDAESPCNEGADPYNQQASILFEGTRDALLERLEEQLPEREVRILQVYGQGAEENDRIMSPSQALEEAKEWNATHVLDLPYELPGNGFDNLIGHRRSYGFEPEQAPYYGPGYETKFTRNGMEVRILSSAVAVEGKAHAQVHMIKDALQNLMGKQDPEGQEYGQDHQSVVRVPQDARSQGQWILPAWGVRP